MIESIMLALIGVLSGGLVGLAVAPLVHNRAVRLTTRQLEAALPESKQQIRAQKDLLRAEFAVSTRRLEITVAELRNKITGHLVELGRKSDTLNRLKGERDALRRELIVLKGQVEALKKQTMTTPLHIRVGSEAVTLIRQWRLLRNMHH